MKAEEIFDQAIQMTANEQRDAYVASACGTDAALLAKIQSLLKAHDEASQFLQQSLFESAPTVDQVPSEGPGTVIGPYKLLQEIGHGGMGVVFMAEQSQPVKRRVALKIIKPGMDSRQVIARFEAERQALSLMDHPNIARVLDAGTTSSGRPYFVMELVKGQPITQYCDEHHMTPRQRLELLLPVCQAIQHAHQKGIIHRDIKPSNILVAEYDSKPVPKVIDFGVAKAIHQPLTDKTMFTGFGNIVGTLEYMSPEQAKVNQLDIDTRSDIYSLGVLMYELLTGSTPFDRKRLKQAAWDEMLRIIREEEPQRPSTRISTTDELPSIAVKRGMEPKKLSSLVHGELDWIVMKALDKDRNRRYETANGFAMDLQRYLANEAVTACPPSAGYRFRKFVSRNKAKVLAASLILFALIGGIIGTSWGLLKARMERDEKEMARQAEANERAKAVVAKKEAEENEAEAKSVVKFFEEKVFAAGRPKGQLGGLGADVSLRDAIIASLPELEKSFTKQPLVEAHLRRALGTSFYILGDYELARTQDERALVLYNQHLGAEHPNTLSIMNNMAATLNELGRHQEAAMLQEKSLEIQKRVLPKDHPDMLVGMNNLANSYAALKRHQEAINLQKECLEIQKRVLGCDHPDTLGSMSNLASCYVELNQHDEAVKLNLECLEIRNRVLGKDHPNTLVSMNNLASNYAALNRQQEAIELYYVCLENQKRVLGKDHPHTLKSMNNLAISYAALNRHHEAVKLFEESFAIQNRILPKNHPDILRCMLHQAFSYASLNRHQEAVNLYAQYLELQKKVIPKDHLTTFWCMNALADSYTHLKRHHNLLKLLTEILEIQKKELPHDNPEIPRAMNNLAWFLLTTVEVNLRDHQEALTLSRKAIELTKDNWVNLDTHSLAAYRNGLWRESLESREKMIKLRKPRTEDIFFLAMCLWKLDRKDDAKNRYAEAIAEFVKQPKPDAGLIEIKLEAETLLGSTTSRTPSVK